jgi:hypothetical protein
LFTCLASLLEIHIPITILRCHVTKRCQIKLFNFVSITHADFPKQKRHRKRKTEKQVRERERGEGMITGVEGRKKKKFPLSHR